MHVVLSLFCITIARRGVGVLVLCLSPFRFSVNWVFSLHKNQQCDIHSVGHEDVLFRTDIITAIQIVCKQSSRTHCSSHLHVYAVIVSQRIRSNIHWQRLWPSATYQTNPATVYARPERIKIRNKTTMFCKWFVGTNTMICRYSGLTSFKVWSKAQTVYKVSLKQQQIKH